MTEKDFFVGAECVADFDENGQARINTKPFPTYLILEGEEGVSGKLEVRLIAQRGGGQKATWYDCEVIRVAKPKKYGKARKKPRRTREMETQRAVASAA